MTEEQRKYLMDKDLMGVAFISPPSRVGSWWFDPNPSGTGMYFSMYAKPTDEQIANTEKAFGWKWEDVK